MSNSWGEVQYLKRTLFCVDTYNNLRREGKLQRPAISKSTHLLSGKSRMVFKKSIHVMLGDKPSRPWEGYAEAHLNQEWANWDFDFSRFMRSLVRYPKGGYGRDWRDSPKRVKSSKARSEGYGSWGTQGVPAFWGGKFSEILLNISNIFLKFFTKKPEKFLTRKKR